MPTSDRPDEQFDTSPDDDAKESALKKPPGAPAGNESNNLLGDPNDVGAAGDYSR